jgi:hypothetical protein
VSAEKKCELNTNELEDQLILYSCDRHKLGDADAEKLEFNRSPAVIEQFSRKLKDLQAKN